jgi:hypothetical protein
VASYLVRVRQFTAFLQPHGRELTEATRACAKRRATTLRPWSISPILQLDRSGGKP